MSLHPRSVAILGAGGVIGRILTEALQEDADVERIILVDDRPLSNLPSKAQFHRIDLGDDAAVSAISALIDETDLDCLVYMGYLSDERERQETQTQDVSRVVKALSTRPVPKVIFASSTTVYGALPGDPTHLNETAALATDPISDWVRDKVKAESVYEDFLLDSDSTVTVLRFGLPLGPTVDNFVTDYLGRKAVPVVVGQDPPVQFVHELDVSGSIHHAIKHDCDGIYNVVGDGAMPLSVALRIGRRRSAPVPELGSYPLHHALWEPDIIEAPAVLSDLFRYVWIADGTKAQKEMKYAPRKSTKETIEDFYKR